MKVVMMAAALCAGILSANAQSTPSEKKDKAATTSAQKPAAQADHKDCLRTSDAEWKTLGLSAEQMTQVKAIQAEHEKACSSMKKDEAGVKDDAAKAEMADAHEARIKDVLTPAQYDSWQKQCTAMATPAKPMEKK